MAKVDPKISALSTHIAWLTIYRFPLEPSAMGKPNPKVEIDFETLSKSSSWADLLENRFKDGL